MTGTSTFRAAEGRVLEFSLVVPLFGELVFLFKFQKFESNLPSSSCGGSASNWVRSLNWEGSVSNGGAGWDGGGQFPDSHIVVGGG